LGLTLAQDKLLVPPPVDPVKLAKTNLVSPDVSKASLNTVGATKLQDLNASGIKAQDLLMKD
jgi:hypothetical protein